jgi:addiction module HigA family antidote
MRKLSPIIPGELLMEEFLKPMGISQYRLAKEIGVPAQRIGEIVSGKRAITADTDLRLCRFFSLSDGYWLRGQARYDTEVAKDALGKILAGIRPWAGLGALASSGPTPGSSRPSRLRRVGG